MCLYFLLYVVFTSYKFTPPTPIQTTPRGVTAAHCAINIKSRLILCRVARVVSLLHNSVTKCWKFVKIRVCQWLLPHLNCILCINWHYLLLQKLVAAIVELRSNPWYHQDQHWTQRCLPLNQQWRWLPPRQTSRRWSCCQMTRWQGIKCWLWTFSPSYLLSLLQQGLLFWLLCPLWYPRGNAEGWSQNSDIQVILITFD